MFEFQHLKSSHRPCPATPQLLPSTTPAAPSGEHRLFCHITQNWRGKPLRTFETIVDLIGNTRTTAGLRVKAKLDEGTCPTGAKVTNAQMKALSLTRHDFHGDWNYEIHPRTVGDDTKLAR